MKPHRLFALLASLALVLAAGCGGGGGGGGGGGDGSSNVKGSVTLLADWTGPEGQSIQAVLDGFKKANPKVKVKYQPSTNLTQDLSTAVEGGNPPDLAAIPSPGIMKDYQKRGAIKPIEFARSEVEDNFNKDWVDLGTINGKLYGVFFKGANKSTIWYSKQAFTNAGVQPPESWDDLMKAADTLKASGVTPWSIDAGDGWPLTDFFENIYASTAGPDKYRQLADHQIPWTDPSVKQALQIMGGVFKKSDQIVGGTSGALQTELTKSVTAVFSKPPKAAMMPEGDFVPGVVAGKAPAKVGTDVDFFNFPPAGDNTVVVGGGNVVVMFKDSPAAQALVKYLASPEAGEIWAKRGGFSSPNKNVSEDAYPDDITRRSATALANADSFVFDMSDLAPGQFGSADEWTLLQGFFKNPDDVDGAAAKLEAAAKKAYSGS
jgi:ABC-type glycerol-3-phosphate transport system substrate-binding protein